MKKTNLFLTIAAVVNVLAFSGCNKENTTNSSSSTKNSSSIVPTKLVEQDLSVVGYSGKKINNVNINIYKGETLVETVVTNFIGNAKVNIYPGEYSVKLTNLPIGYIADDSYEYVVGTKYAKVEFKCGSSVISEELPQNHKYKTSDIMYNFDFIDTDDNDRSLKSLFEEEGKDLVILTFWATWCGYCLNEFPYFDEVDAAYGDKAEIVGLNADYQNVDTDDRIISFKEEMEIPWTMALGNFSNLAYNVFGANGIPLTVFVSKYGVIEFMQNGMFPSEGDVFTKVETYLEKIG